MVLLVLPDGTTFNPEMVIAIADNAAAEATEIYLMYGHVIQTETPVRDVVAALNRFHAEVTGSTE